MEVSRHSGHSRKRRDSAKRRRKRFPRHVTGVAPLRDRQGQHDRQDPGCDSERCAEDEEADCTGQYDPALLRRVLNAHVPLSVATGGSGEPLSSACRTAATNSRISTAEKFAARCTMSFFLERDRWLALTLMRGNAIGRLRRRATAAVDVTRCVTDVRICRALGGSNTERPSSRDDLAGHCRASRHGRRECGTPPTSARGSPPTDSTCAL